MKLLYRPFGIVAGILAGILGRKAFDKVWGAVQDEEPPEATTEQASWPKVLGAALVQGAIFSVVRAAVNRSGASGWRWLTGVWPGERRPDPE
jgi:hypothetical protein